MCTYFTKLCGSIINIFLSYLQVLNKKPSKCSGPSTVVLLISISVTLFGITSFILKIFMMFSIVCISVGFPTSILLLIYDYKRKRFFDDMKDKRSWSYIRSARRCEISAEKHMEMMLADPLLRNPIIYLRHRCCTDTRMGCIDMTSHNADYTILTSPVT